METQASYTYVCGVNTVVFRIIKPKRSPLVLLLFSLAAAVVVGLSGTLLPDNVRQIIAGNYIAPFVDCNAMQLVLMGFIFGIGLLRLEPETKQLSGTLESLRHLLLW